MRLENFYWEIGSDYATVLERFSDDKEMLEHFVTTFPNDETMNNIRIAVQNNDDKAIEETTHALKGITANLAFNQLYAACSKLVETIRHRRKEDIQKDFATVEQEYTIIVDHIEHFKDK